MELELGFLGLDPVVTILYNEKPQPDSIAYGNNYLKTGNNHAQCAEIRGTAS
jgi:hypothetical protein